MINEHIDFLKFEYQITPNPSRGIFSIRISNRINKIGEHVVTAELSDLHGKPVSYTHLRAHETVLDLVCRLLLEKKNKTRTKKKSANKRQHVSNKDSRTDTTLAQEKKTNNNNDTRSVCEKDKSK
mgnify:CR=1 FL=1